MRKQKKGLKTILVLLLAAVGLPLMGQIQVTLNVNQPASLQASAGLDQLICPDDSAQLGGAPAAVNGTSPYSYAWTPTTGLTSSTIANPSASPVASTSFILEVRDANGCSAYDTVTVTVDTCVGIGAGAWNPALAIFPNPNQGNFTLSMDHPNLSGDVTVEIWTLTGQRVYLAQPQAIAGHFESRIDLSSYGKGTYLITVKSAQGTITRQMVVQ